MSTYEIKSHKLVVDSKPVEYIRSPNQSGQIVPQYLVLHDTAGPSLESAVNWFKQRNASASAHLTIGRDGKIVQMVDFNRKAWHAGKSIWEGRSNVNDFSIGIEIVNPGLLTKHGEFYKPWYKASYKDSNEEGNGDIRQGNGSFGRYNWSGWWMDYTPEQIEAVTFISNVLVKKYSLRKILTHWMISPGRKIDTNPLFPLQQVIDLAYSSNPTLNPDTSKSTQDGGMYVTTKTALNLRKWPSFYEENIIGVIPQGTRLAEIRSGTFQLSPRDTKIMNDFGDTIEWTYVRSGSQEGWVVSSYLDMA